MVKFKSVYKTHWGLKHGPYFFRGINLLYLERSDLMKKTLRLAILTETKENVLHDLDMLQSFNFVTTDIKEKQILLNKIKYTKEVLEEIDQMISEL